MNSPRELDKIPGILVLEDARSGNLVEFPGDLFGAEISAAKILEFRQTRGAQNQTARDFGYGEVVFNTSMTGYQEILTDPSYYGQMICMTVPHIGNTGVNAEDMESSGPYCAGFIVHELSRTRSNWRSNFDLDAFLKKREVPGLCNVDTRALTRFIRQFGVVRGVILPLSEKSEAARLLKEMPHFEGRDLIAEVSCQKAYAWKSDQTFGKIAQSVRAKPFKVVAVDYGVKWNLLRELELRGCAIEVVPAKTSAREILAKKPDGVFLTNGPGDPAAAPYAVEAVKGILGHTPIFGVCMGHQILSLALGGKTYKLKFGHRGGNQPVQDNGTRKVEISSHNHGYSVEGSSLPSFVKVTHVNLNDKTVEGISVEEKMAFSVQYHPEACPGPHDSDGLFDRFVQWMEKHHAAKVS